VVLPGVMVIRAGDVADWFDRTTYSPGEVANRKVWLPVTTCMATNRLFLRSWTRTGMALNCAWVRNGPSHGDATPETTPRTGCPVLAGDEAVDEQPDAIATKGRSAVANSQRIDN
jgi:hypothetical protein